MLTRIESIFSDLKARNARALMPYVCGGHPGPGATRQVLGALQRGGASLVEVGIPFSDPIADGPVIAAAMHTALQRGATPRSVLDEISAARAEVSVGIVAMISVSIVWKLGPDRLITEAAQAGIDGFIFPDVILEEAATLLGQCRDAGIGTSLLIAPTTPFKRAEQIAKACTGFVYLLARAGITGERAELPDIAPRVQKLRTVTDLPIAVGFGISGPDHVRHVTSAADAAIVGSALVRRMTDADAAGQDAIAAAEGFCRELATGLSTPAGNPA